MADEILVDLNAVFEMASELGENLAADEQGPVLQVMATVALCERLDALKKEVADFAAWFQAVSPRS